MDSALGAGDFICGADEDADFVGKCSGGELCLNPRSDVLFLVFHVGMGGDFGWHTVEGADGVVSRFHIPVGVGDFRAEEPVGMGADLVRGAVVDPEGSRAASNVYTERLPGEGLLKDALPDISCEEEGGGAVAAERGEESQLRDTQVLGFINDRMLKRRLGGLGDMFRKPSEDCRLGEEVFGGEFLAEGGEDLPEGLAACFGESGFATQSSHIAVAFPAFDLPRIDHLFPLGPEKIWRELGGKTRCHFLQAGVHLGSREYFCRAEKGFVESQTQRGHGVDIDALGESWLGSQEAAELGFQSTGERFGECGEEDSGLGLGASKETRCR